MNRPSSPRAMSYSYIRSIADILNSANTPCSFASGGQFLLPPPALKIDGVEDYVGLPVGKLQAKAIIAVCTQASFGRGLAEPIVDTDYNMWELDPSQFTITNPQWNTHLESLAAVVKDELGCNPKLSVKCELYKFLLYGQESFFKPHYDREKVDKMFGTLVIQLPSDYDGGELRVWHCNEEKIFNFSGLKGVGDYNYIAFFADCVHELCEVTRGNRLCLVYNLFYSGDCAYPFPIESHEFAAEVVEDLKKWEQDDDGIPYIAYVLDHSYCEASLSFDLLTDGDGTKAEVLLEAEKQMNFCLYLGIIILRQFCTMGNEYGRRRYGFSRENCYVNYVEEEELFIEKLVSSSGECLDRMSIAHMRLNHGVIIPENIVTGEPTGENFLPCTYTGDEAALDRIYHKAALFIWPKKHTILVTGDVNDAIDDLSSKLQEPQDNQQLREEYIDMAKELVAVSSNSDFCPCGVNVLILLDCLKELKTINLVCQYFKAISIHHLHLLQHPNQEEFFSELLELGDVFGWEQLEEAILVFFEGAIAREMINSACQCLFSLANGSMSSQRFKVCQKLVDVICFALSNEQDFAQIHPRNNMVHMIAQGVRSKDFICDLFKTLRVLKCEDKLVVVIPTFFRQPKRYSLVDTLVPAALELHQTMKENSSTALTSLISHCVSALEQHTQQAPTWSLQANFKCRCEFCTNLVAFLNDPQKTVTRFSTNQSTHSHLKQQLWNNSDVKCTTEQHASTDTLVVTKTEDRFKIHQLLERIRPLLSQEQPPGKRQKLDDDNS